MLALSRRCGRLDGWQHGTEVITGMDHCFDQSVQLEQRRLISKRILDIVFGIDGLHQPLREI